MIVPSVVVGEGEMRVGPSKSPCHNVVLSRSACVHNIHDLITYGLQRERDIQKKEPIGVDSLETSFSSTDHEHTKANRIDQSSRPVFFTSQIRANNRMATVTAASVVNTAVTTMARLPR